MTCEGLLLKNGQRKPDSIQQPFWIPDEFDYEDYTGYRKGGYCPIIPYQTLKDSRYRVVYKLGYGHSATVWLAHDDQSSDKRLVALKILTADRTTSSSSEANLLRTVAKSDVGLGPTYVINILDEFKTESANGIHQVLVMPVTRSVMSLFNSRAPFRSIVKSFVQGLHRIHSAGVVHGGRKQDSL